jgi:small GTP-binding protein
LLSGKPRKNHTTTEVKMRSHTGGSAATASGGHTTDIEIVKCIVIGDSGAGKSSILSRFTENRFLDESNQTIGVEFASRLVQLKDRSVKLHIWDTAGQERYRSITRSYYRGAALCIIVYDVTRRESFEHVANWLSDVNCLAQQKVSCLLLGNKLDMAASRAVSMSEAAQFAQSHSMAHLECSAKTGEHVEEAFSTLLRLHLARLDGGEQLTVDPSSCHCDVEDDVSISLRSGRKQRQCCKS